MGELLKCGERGGDTSMLFRLLSGAKIKRTRSTLKLERREEILVECAVVEGEFKNGVQRRGGRRG